VKNDYIQLLLLFLIVFLLGWVANAFYTQYTTYSAIEQPISINTFLNPTNFERNSPSDHIKESMIHVYNDNIIIDLKDASWSSFVDSNSMDPVLDTGSNGIEIKPIKTSQISKGDIISFRSSFAKGIIIHRVVDIGVDEQGWYAITKGDNNPTADPDKVRFDQIQGIVVGVIY
jgi:signal peptidase